MLKDHLYIKNHPHLVIQKNQFISRHPVHLKLWNQTNIKKEQIVLINIYKNKIEMTTLPKLKILKANPDKLFLFYQIFKKLIKKNGL
jgi:hypothetical protein